MLRWVRGGTSDHPLEDKEDARHLLGDLADKGPFRALEELSGFLDAVKTADRLKPIRAFEIVELLDRTSRPFVRKLNFDYVTGVKLTRFQQHRLWYSAHTFLTQLAEGYRFCLAQFEVGAIGAAALKPSLPKIAARALRAYAQQLKWSLLRYGPIERDVWENLARLYNAAETLGFAPWLLTPYRGERSDTSSEREFLRPLLLAVSSPDGLQPIQIELADRLIARCSDAFVLSPKPMDGLHYTTDLTAAFPPGRISPSVTVTVQTRFFGPGDAARRVQHYIDVVEATGKIPDEMNLGLDVPAVVVLDTLQHLARYWAPRLPERKEARKRRTEHVSVVHEFGEVVANAGGLFFESPFVTNDEEWVLENESSRGFGAFVPKALGAWLRVGCLIAVRREEGVTWGVGIVRRVVADEQGNRYAGIEMLSHGGAAVTLFNEQRATPGRGHLSEEGELCVLLPSATTRSGEGLLLLRPGVFTPRQTLEMRAYDRRYRLHPVRIVEAGEDYTVGKFRVEEL